MSHCGTWFTRIGLRASTSMKRSSTPYGGSDSLKFPSSEAIHTYGASSRNSFPSSVCRVRFRVQVVAQEQKLANSVLQQSRARPFAPTGSLWLGSVPVHIVSRDFLVSKPTGYARGGQSGVTLLSPAFALASWLASRLRSYLNRCTASLYSPSLRIRTQHPTHWVRASFWAWRRIATCRYTPQVIPRKTPTSRRWSPGSAERQHEAV